MAVRIRTYEIGDPPTVFEAVSGVCSRRSHAANRPEEANTPKADAGYRTRVRCARE
jgi:hypothetical protein